MTNPPTPEDKVEAILEDLASSTMIYQHSIELGKAETGYFNRRFDTARYALLALLNEARIETAQYIEDNFVSPAGGYCDEIAIDAIPNYITELRAATPKENA